MIVSFPNNALMQFINIGGGGIFFICKSMATIFFTIDGLLLVYNKVVRIFWVHCILQGSNLIIKSIKGLVDPTYL